MSELGEGAGILRELAVKLGFDVDQEKFEHFEKQIEVIKIGLEGLVVGWHLAVLGAFELAHQVAETGHEIENSAVALGLSTDAYQKYSYAAKVAGLGSEAFFVGVQHLTMQLGEAARAGGPARLLFHRMGIAFSDGAGHARKAEDVLEDVSRVLGKTANASTRNMYAMELFGRAGVRLGALLAKPKEEIAELAKDLMLFGYMDEDALKTAAEGEKAFTGFFTLIKGMKNELGLALLPAVTRILQRMREWIHAHADLIHSKIESFAKNLATFIEAGARAALRFVHALGQVVDMLGGVTNTLNLLGVAFLSVFGAALFTNLGSVVKYLKLMATLGGMVDLEFLLVAAAIAAVVIAIQDFYVWVKGGDSIIGQWLGPFDKLGDTHRDLLLVIDDMKSLYAAGKDLAKLSMDVMTGDWKAVGADLKSGVDKMRKDASTPQTPAEAKAIHEAFGDFNADQGMPAWVVKFGHWLNPTYGQPTATAPAVGRPDGMAAGVPAAGRPTFSPLLTPVPQGQSYAGPVPASGGPSGPMQNTFDMQFIFPPGTPEDHASKIADIVDERIERLVTHSVQQSAPRAK